MTRDQYLSHLKRQYQKVLPRYVDQLFEYYERVICLHFPDGPRGHVEHLCHRLTWDSLEDAK